MSEPCVEAVTPLAGIQTVWSSSQSSRSSKLSYSCDKHFTYRIVLFVTCTRHEYSWNTSPLTLNNNKSTKLLCQLFLIKINNFTYWELKIVAPVAPFLRHFDIFWLCMKYLQLDVIQPTIDCDVIMNTSFQYLNWQISTYLTLISGVSR